MTHEKGQLRVNTENLLPIIKKWLYSDRDIFLRELVSNAVDAITKLKKINGIGLVDITDDFRVDVTVDKENKQIVVEDNGIGMTRDEVDEYINQVAFSGAVDFVNKYCDNEDAEGIIGHFGLGFYSAFMVADSVEIDTLSYVEGAEPVHWYSDGGSEYEISPGKREKRGTRIMLHLSAESADVADEAEQILAKYCAFLPEPIFLHDDNDENKEDNQINDTEPLWNKAPSECTEEEYKAFYHKVFADISDPLFWIHLNVDYPFNLKGILYFPRLNQEMHGIEGQIKLYNNQVYVADNIKEVIPEYLLLLKGVIDCPDLPLNVSRSFLQNDGFVGKISAHITKKVADRLTGLFNTERETYQKYWDDINPFIKYGCMRDDKFYDRVSPCLLLKTIQGNYLTIDEYLELNKEKHENKIYYVNDLEQQAQYMDLFNQNDLSAVILNTVIDSAFLQMIESKREGVKFIRIDAALADALKSEAVSEISEEKKSDITEMFRNAASDQNLEVKFEALQDGGISAMLLVDELDRRMQDFARMYGDKAAEWMGKMPVKRTLVVNTSSKLIEKLAVTKDEVLCAQIYDLALLMHGSLKPEQLKAFITRTNNLLADKE